MGLEKGLMTDFVVSVMMTGFNTESVLTGSLRLLINGRSAFKAMLS